MTINIYSPLYPNCSGIIFADLDGLKKLKIAVEQALEVGQSSFIDLDSDGESYSVEVQKITPGKLANISPVYLHAES